MSELAEFGPLDTCLNIMRAYELYRYNLLKEKYKKHEFNCAKKRGER